jgi:hypothetical protein
VVVLVTGTVIAIASALNGYAAWAGAQRSSPGQEIRKVSARLDSLVNCGRAA